MIATGDKGPAQGLILFAHGSREPEWATPFERLVARVRAAAPSHEVRLAFLERMHPSLGEVVAELVGHRVPKITVVPIFLGAGGHARRDLPHIMAELRARHSGVAIELAAPAGEEDSVLEAIARYCARQLRDRTNDV